jgi:hypothetical protein
VVCILENTQQPPPPPPRGEEISADVIWGKIWIGEEKKEENVKGRKGRKGKEMRKREIKG